MFEVLEFKQQIAVQEATRTKFVSHKYYIDMLVRLALIAFFGVAGIGQAAAVNCEVTFSPGENVPSTVSAKPSGTTFCFSPGTYRLTTYITPKDNDVFSGSSGAILNGSALVTSWTQSGNYWVASNQPQLIAQTNAVCLGGGTACQFPDALFLDSNPLNRVLSLSDVVSGSFYRDYASKQIYIADNPTGHTMEVIVSPEAFLANGTGVTDVTIEGLTIEKFAGNIAGAVEGGTTWIIQNNEVLLNHGDGIDASGTILGNYSHNNGDFGLEGGYATTAMDVENNELAFNNWANFANGGGAKFEYATNLIVRNNYVHDNNGPGLHTDGDCLNVLYDSNHTQNNKNAGILHEISWDAVISNNLLEDETAVFPQYSAVSMFDHNAIGIANSSNVQVYGNTISNSTMGIGGELSSQRGDSTHGPHAGQPYLLQNLDVHDNTFSQISSTAAGIIKASAYDNSVYTSWNNHFANDTYELPNTSGLYFLWMNSPGYPTYTWAEWKSSGNDVQGSFVPPGTGTGSAGSLTAPTNVAATAASSSEINLTWTASSGATEYKIYRGQSVQIGTSTTNTYSDKGLLAGTKYRYSVAAVNSAGTTSAQSAYAAATTAK